MTYELTQCLKSSSISRLAVIGGGRWARVIAEVLHRILPSNIILSVHSKRNVQALEAWSSSLVAGERIVISEEWPELNEARDCAVIVVNAVRDHADAVKRALSSGAPVLVEKPVALSAGDVERLMALSQAEGVCFAAAHVFKFASYIGNFAEHIPSLKAIQVIRVCWADPQLESRYGEVKQYDPGVPIYVDCLPHVVSILNQLIPETLLLFETLQFHRGGAHLILQLLFGRSTCVIELERNSKQRKRFVEIEYDDRQKLQLDFSTEPGLIYDGDDCCSAALDWEIAQRPMEKMLRAFIDSASGGAFDPRLDSCLGLSAAELIDHVKKDYERMQVAWLTERLAGHSENISEDIKYALSEILQRSERLSEDELSQRLTGLRMTFDGCVDEAWLRKTELMY
ncbi:MAG: Gfo/Idh/MocA family oxidoreductase [Legionellaceae bacterium]|nr:Gfo/Idh/MocA family oxidoreductase [Legionellaceae bacterium]